MFRLRPKLNYSNVIATVALFVALGGAAVAAGIHKNSVGPRQLKRGAVTAAKIRKGAVRSGKLAPKSVTAGKLGPNSVGPGNIGNGAVTSAKLAAGSVLATAIKNGVVTTNKLANEAVTAAKLGKGSVTLAKLGDEVAPLLGTLRSGQTLRGVFNLGANGEEIEYVSDGVSFQFPLASTPTINPVLSAGATSANCPGLGGGSQQTPNANPGNLCVYISAQSGKVNSLVVQNPSRLGFGLRANLEKDSSNNVTGFWAVTAP
jgi:hypothetical protein